MLSKRIVNIFSLATLLMLSELSIAASPLPFYAYYDARFQGFKADAEISLTQLNDAEYIANTTIKIRLFGATMSTIREISEFDWHDDAPRPHHYEYNQSGIGGRNRSVDFDWQNNLAIATVKNESVELQLAGGTLDELSMYTYIKQEINKGNNDIFFPLVRRNTVEEYHYQTIGEEEVVTESGTFLAIKVERIRENSDRLTQLWFAKNHDMLLVKLFQRDPDGDEFEITLTSAQVNGEIVSPD
jgi:hypothetical protein